jgi:hypothetical protein
VKHHIDCRLRLVGNEVAYFNVVFDQSTASVV